MVSSSLESNHEMHCVGPLMFDSVGLIVMSGPVLCVFINVTVTKQGALWENLPMRATFKENNRTQILKITIILAGFILVDPRKAINVNLTVFT